MNTLDNMSKKQLEAYARKELDIELDRRHSKKDLLTIVKSKLKSVPSITEEPITDSKSAVESISRACNEDPYIQVLASAKAQVGNDLVKLREHIQYLNDTSQENYQLILNEIDKYND
jgi:hypothetical protein|tara:strand:- start:3582 stop:3932 length:351 start_codon:yes stop_codon:yes gene_type:complete